MHTNDVNKSNSRDGVNDKNDDDAGDSGTVMNDRTHFCTKILSTCIATTRELTAHGFLALASNG